jgi:hypothetical protein
MRSPQPLLRRGKLSTTGAGPKPNQHATEHSHAFAVPTLAPAPLRMHASHPAGRGSGTCAIGSLKKQCLGEIHTARAANIPDCRSRAGAHIQRKITKDGPRWWLKARQGEACAVAIGASQSKQPAVSLALQESMSRPRSQGCSVRRHGLEDLVGILWTPTAPRMPQQHGVCRAKPGVCSGGGGRVDARASSQSVAQAGTRCKKNSPCTERAATEHFSCSSATALCHSSKIALRPSQQLHWCCTPASCKAAAQRGNCLHKTSERQI